MKRIIRNAAVVAAAGLAVFALLGEGSEDSKSDSKQDNGGAVQSDGGGSSESASGVGTSTANPVPIGTGVQVAKGWEGKVNSAVIDANETVANGNQFMTPDAGKQYVMANVSLTNTSDKPDTWSFNVKMSALPSSGVAIDRAFVVDLPDELDWNAQLQPGATITGNVVFEVPTAEAASTVLLAEPQLTLDENEDQRFFALQ